MNTIAIIGMGCRFPGANDPQSLWDIMRNGINTITEVPTDRWFIDKFYHPEPSTPGKMNTRFGGFLEQVDQFEPSFFGISPREAKSIDPQQRLVLEVAWEALENAGIVPGSLSGSKTGVFIGICGSDYDRLGCRDFAQLDAYSGTGTSFSIAANRLSYLMNLQGPSIAIDTACSSSLTAIHLACQSLHTRESNLCLVGGVNIISWPGPTITFSQANMMASDGLCKTFDASADGYVRGEGCGLVVLKRYSEALRDGDKILAVIRGSAVNHDGLSNGLTAPNGTSQQMVIRQALKNAGVAPAQISYVEAHGTGTSLGDPIEVKSLKSVLMEGRQLDQPCWIGSVKTNIGHLEAAAGIAGLIKVVLSLQYREIPPHLHLKQLNPYISLEGTSISIPTELQPWTSGTESRFAGISAFSFGGANAHVVVEEAPIVTSEVSEVERPQHLLTLSAKNESALRELAQRYQEFIAKYPETSLADIGFTANKGRSHFDHRLAIVATSHQQLQEALNAVTQGKEISGLVTSQIKTKKRPKIAFLFTGQGSQYLGMGQQLYNTQPTFRDALDHCDEILRPYWGEALIKVLYPEPGTTSPLDQTFYTQPALFALEYAIFQLWKSWGIEPTVVMGHSLGEYVAACVAGVFSLEDGLKLVVERARLMQSLPPTGEMVAVLATKAVIESITVIDEQQVAIAAYNGANNTVISGERQAVQSICSALEAQGIITKKLQTSHAFHSPLMEPILAQFQILAASITYNPPQIEIISNLTAQPLTAAAINADYWCHHLRAPVQFAASLETLAAVGYQFFVEIGPKPVLLGMGRHCLPEVEAVWLPSLRPGYDDWQQMLLSLAQLYVHGVSVDWSGFDQNYPRQLVSLPTYPFQRQRYWLDTTALDLNGTRIAIQNDIQSKVLHPLVSQRLNSALREIQFESQISQNCPVYLKDHRVFGAVIFPTTAYLEMVLAVGANVFQSNNLVVEAVNIQTPLILPEDEVRTVQLILIPEDSKAYSFQIFSLNSTIENSEPSWTLHTSGKVLVGDKDSQFPQTNLSILQASCHQESSIKDYYQQFRDRGIDYGSSFQGIEQLWQQEEFALGHIRLPEPLISEIEDYQLHPVLLDASFQVLGAAISQNNQADIYLPVGLENLRIYRRPTTNIWSHAQVRPAKNSNQKTLIGDICLFSPDGQIIAVVEGLLMKQASRQALLGTTQESLQNWFYEVEWRQKASLSDKKKSFDHLSTSFATPKSWLILVDESGIGKQLATHLQSQGEECTLVFSGSEYKQLTRQEFRINPTNPDNYQQLLKVVGENQPPLKGVINCWSLNALQVTHLTADDLEKASQQGCGSTLHLVKALVGAGFVEPPFLCLVTQGAVSVGVKANLPGVAQSSLWGMGKVIALEHPELNCVLVDLDPNPVANEAAQVLFEEICSKDTENQVAYRNNVRYVARLIRSRQALERLLEDKHNLPQSQSFQLGISTKGILDNLELQPTTRRQPVFGEVEIRVRATGLNFLDVLDALGLLPFERGWFGAECSGVVVAIGEGVEGLEIGDAVLAIAPSSCSQYVTVKTTMVTPKPENITFEEAATIPANFLTAYYALHHVAKISAGDRVLIHAAAGGTGMAAVQIAQQAGAKVFGTASAGKWEFLKSLGVEHIMNSRSLDFANEVMAITEGKGVDIVLNSLAGEFIPKSLSVLGDKGYFLEIGKNGVWDASQVANVKPDVVYSIVDLIQVCQQQPDLIQSMLRHLMQQFQEGKLKPLPQTVFSIDKVVDAFRYMQQAKHIGKIVVSQELENNDSTSRLPLTFREDSTYLITGGLGALGLLVARFLVERGAKNLVLVGRSTPSQAVSNQLRELESAGAQVIVAKADISSVEQVVQVLKDIEQYPLAPLRGIIHAVGVLDDGILQQLTWERFSRVMAPKVQGAWHLHTLTQNLPLDFFVLFSSAASLLGSPGQANYAAANAFLDALAYSRQDQGLPGLSINWGTWAEVGLAAKHQADERMKIKGIESISPQKGLEVLEQLFSHSSAQIGVVPINWSHFSDQLTRLPFLADFQQVSNQSREEDSKFLQQLKEAPVEQRRAYLIAHVQTQVAKVLGLNISESIDLEQGFFDLGMDSLTSVELRNRLQVSLGCVIPSTAAFDYPTVAALVDYLAGEVLGLEFTSESVTPSQNASDESNRAASLEELSQDEIADLLAQELAALMEEKV
ncbi:beta-ketoacyl synthase [Cylindrospermum sp. NIES-4074]|nr:beta-ketoacyl synthase [Cylindrospermum sp. NIES-4074]